MNRENFCRVHHAGVGRASSDSHVGSYVTCEVMPVSMWRLAGIDAVASMWWPAGIDAVARSSIMEKSIATFVNPGRIEKCTSAQDDSHDRGADRSLFLELDRSLFLLTCRN